MYLNHFFFSSIKMDFEAQIDRHSGQPVRAWLILVDWSPATFRLCADGSLLALRILKTLRQLLLHLASLLQHSSPPDSAHHDDSPTTGNRHTDSHQGMSTHKSSSRGVSVSVLAYLGSGQAQFLCINHVITSTHLHLSTHHLIRQLRALEVKSTLSSSSSSFSSSSSSSSIRYPITEWLRIGINASEWTRHAPLGYIVISDGMPVLDIGEWTRCSRAWMPRWYARIGAFYTLLVSTDAQVDQPGMIDAGGDGGPTFVRVPDNGHGVMTLGHAPRYEEIQYFVETCLNGHLLLSHHAPSPPLSSIVNTCQSRLSPTRLIPAALPPPPPTFIMASPSQLHMSTLLHSDDQPVVVPFRDYTLTMPWLDYIIFKIHQGFMLKQWHVTSSAASSSLPVPASAPLHASTTTSDHASSHEASRDRPDRLLIRLDYHWNQYLVISYRIRTALPESAYLRVEVQWVTFQECLPLLLHALRSFSTTAASTTASVATPTATASNLSGSGSGTNGGGHGNGNASGTGTGESVGSVPLLPFQEAFWNVPNVVSKWTELEDQYRRLIQHTLPSTTGPPSTMTSPGAALTGSTTNVVSNEHELDVQKCQAVWDGLTMSAGPSSTSFSVPPTSPRHRVPVGSAGSGVGAAVTFRELYVYSRFKLVSAVDVIDLLCHGSGDALSSDTKWTRLPKSHNVLARRISHQAHQPAPQAHGQQQQQQAQGICFVSAKMERDKVTTLDLWCFRLSFTQCESVHADLCAQLQSLNSTSTTVHHGKGSHGSGHGLVLFKRPGMAFDQTLVFSETRLWNVGVDLGVGVERVGEALIPVVAADLGDALSLLCRLRKAEEYYLMFKNDGRAVYYQEPSTHGHGPSLGIEMEYERLDGEGVIRITARCFSLGGDSNSDIWISKARLLIELDMFRLSSISAYYEILATAMGEGDFGSRSMAGLAVTLELSGLARSSLFMHGCLSREVDVSIPIVEQVHQTKSVSYDEPVSLEDPSGSVIPDVKNDSIGVDPEDQKENLRRFWYFFGVEVQAQFPLKLTSIPSDQVVGAHFSDYEAYVQKYSGDLFAIVLLPPSDSRDPVHCLVCNRKSVYQLPHEAETESILEEVVADVQRLMQRAQIKTLYANTLTGLNGAVKMSDLNLPDMRHLALDIDLTLLMRVMGELGSKSAEEVVRHQIKEAISRAFYLPSDSCIWLYRPSSLDVRKREQVLRLAETPLFLRFDVCVRRNDVETLNDELLNGDVINVPVSLQQLDWTNTSLHPSKFRPTPFSVDLSSESPRVILKIQCYSLGIMKVRTPLQSQGVLADSQGSQDELPISSSFVRSLPVDERSALIDLEMGIETVARDEIMHNLLVFDERFQADIVCLIGQYLKKGGSNFCDKMTFSFSYVKAETGASLFQSELAKLQLGEYEMLSVDRFLCVKRRPSDDLHSESVVKGLGISEVLGDFWMLVFLDKNTVQSWMFSKLLSQKQREDFLGSFRDALQNLVHKTNQMSLLLELNSGRFCSRYLIAPEETDLDDDEEDDTEIKGKFRIGQFECSLVRQWTFPLHFRFRTMQALNSLSANVLHPLAVSNRKNLFVYAQGDVVFYFRLVEVEPDTSRRESTLTPHIVIDEKSSPTAATASTLSRNPPSPSTPRRFNSAQDQGGVLVLNMYGVEAPQESLVSDFIKMLENRLNTFTLNLISGFLARNVNLKLTQADIDFIVPSGSRADLEKRFPLPKFVDNPYKFLQFLKQMAGAFLNPFSGSDISNTMRHHFESQKKVKANALSELYYELQPAEVCFLYNAAQSRPTSTQDFFAGQGIACINVCLMDGDEVITSIPVTRNSEAYSDLVESWLDGERPDTSFDVVVEVWHKGNVNAESLLERIDLAFRSCCIDYAVELVVGDAHRLTQMPVILENESDATPTDETIIDRHVKLLLKLLRHVSQIPSTSLNSFKLGFETFKSYFPDILAECYDALADLAIGSPPIVYNVVDGDIWKSFLPRKSWPAANNSLNRCVLISGIPLYSEPAVSNETDRRMSLSFLFRRPSEATTNDEATTPSSAKTTRLQSPFSMKPMIAEETSMFQHAIASYRVDSSRVTRVEFMRHVLVVGEADISGHITWFTYNLGRSLSEEFQKVIRRLETWITDRFSLLNATLLQKAGLFHLRQSLPTSWTSLSVGQMKRKLNQQTVPRQDGVQFGDMSPQLKGRGLGHPFKKLFPQSDVHGATESDPIIRHGSQFIEITKERQVAIESQTQLNEMYVSWAQSGGALEPSCAKRVCCTGAEHRCFSPRCATLCSCCRVAHIFAHCKIRRVNLVLGLPLHPN